MVEEPPEPSLTFALEPIGSSGDMTDKSGLLLALLRKIKGRHAHITRRASPG